MLSLFSKFVLCLIFALTCISSCTDSSVLNNKTAETSATEQAVSTTFYPDAFPEVANASEPGTESIARQNNATNTTTSLIKTEQRAICVTLQAMCTTFIVELLISLSLIGWTKSYTKYLETKLLCIVGLHVGYSLLFSAIEFFSYENIPITCVRKLIVSLSLPNYFSLLMILVCTLLISTNILFLCVAELYGALSINGENEIRIKSSKMLAGLFCLNSVSYCMAIQGAFSILEETTAYSPRFHEIDGIVYDVDFLLAVPLIILLLCFVLGSVYYPTMICDSEKSLKMVRLYMKTIIMQGGLWCLWLMLLQQEEWFLFQVHHYCALAFGIALLIYIYYNRPKNNVEEV